jgi:hypothetical protein
MAMKRDMPRPFLVTEMKVWPTSEPGKAREVETPPQTAKLDRISEVGLEAEVLKKLGKVSRRK